MKLPRFLHKWYAFLFGYFWLPCPICGEDFGGHEWTHGEALMTSWNTGTGVCPNCVEACKKRNAEWMEKNPPPPVEMVIQDYFVPKGWEVIGNPLLHATTSVPGFPIGYPPPEDK